jgi:hypothetical protein
MNVVQNLTDWMV